MHFFGGRKVERPESQACLPGEGGPAIADETPARHGETEE
jgi:hypothetical protein